MSFLSLIAPSPSPSYGSKRHVRKDDDPLRYYQAGFQSHYGCNAQFGPDLKDAIAGIASGARAVGKGAAKVAAGTVGAAKGTAKAAKGAASALAAVPSVITGGLDGLKKGAAAAADKAKVDSKVKEIDKLVKDKDEIHRKATAEIEKLNKDNKSKTDNIEAKSKEKVKGKIDKIFSLMKEAKTLSNNSIYADLDVNDVVKNDVAIFSELKNPYNAK